LDTNVLYYGDNLDILRRYLPDESVDLIYLDPPFNSNRRYNVLFKESEGTSSGAQIQAFTDTWRWDRPAEQTYNELVINGPPRVARMIESMREIIGSNDLMAYLVMMTIRMVELYRVLTKTGSLYLHCDPTASRYLGIMLDTVFGVERFRNEIVWKRTSAHSDAKRYGRVTDSILFYTKGGKWTWNTQYQPYDGEYLKRFRRKDSDGRAWTDYSLSAKGLSGGGYEYEYRDITSLWRVPLRTMKRLDSEGRLHFTSRGGIRRKRYLDEMPGTPTSSVWTDIPPINSQAKERLGYDTQKPMPLVERVIKASSNKGDVVLDPFLGGGTTVVASEMLGRRWIGIDITHLAISLTRKRLSDSFPNLPYDVVGEPKDLEGSRALALQDRYQFQ
jgi:site-specific DNA-methyltransferase (adenine-specific)